MTVKVYTDGSCSPNPGPGGWGFIYFKKDTIFYVKGGESYTTNNRMELMSVLEALKFDSTDKKIVIYSDSQLTINCAKRVFKRNVNIDLWEQFDILSKGREIEWIKVKAHSGDEYNEKVDQLAKEGARMFIK